MISKTQIKYIHSLFQKKFRDETGHYVVEGPKMVSEAITHRRSDIEHIYSLESWVAEGDVHDIRISEISEMDMKRISSLVTPPQVVAVLRKPLWVRPSMLKGITVLLDAIQDPGNLGTIIRTADWFGVKQIVCSEGTVDCFNSKVIQSTMGSIFRMPIFYEDIMSLLDAQPTTALLAASLEGKPLRRDEKWDDVFLVIGNESGGIREEIQERASRKVLIPGHGSAESLNASVAAGILLYELTT